MFINHSVSDWQKVDEHYKKESCLDVRCVRLPPQSDGFFQEVKAVLQFTAFRKSLVKTKATLKIDGKVVNSNVSDLSVREMKGNWILSTKIERYQLLCAKDSAMEFDRVLSWSKKFLVCDMSLSATSAFISA